MKSSSWHASNNGMVVALSISLNNSNGGEVMKIHRQCALLIVSVALIFSCGCGGSGGESDPYQGGEGTVGGTISGVSGTIIIQNLLTDDIEVTEDGSFQFETPISSGNGFQVTILSKPDDLNCTVLNGDGQILSGLNHDLVEIICSPDSYSLGGTLSGLVDGNSLTLINNGETVTISSNGSFTFPEPISDGSSYSVSIHEQSWDEDPAQPYQVCNFLKNEGVISGWDDESIVLYCTYGLQIFVTASTHDGNLGGVAGADEICMNDENYPGIGIYKAMIASEERHTHLDWPFEIGSGYSIGRPNGGNWFNFPLKGSFSSEEYEVWTGMTSKWGTTPDDCDDWTSNSPDDSGRIGLSDQINSDAVNAYSIACDRDDIHLVCVEQN